LSFIRKFKPNDEVVFVVEKLSRGASKNRMVGFGTLGCIFAIDSASLEDSNFDYMHISYTDPVTGEEELCWCYEGDVEFLTEFEIIAETQEITSTDWLNFF